MKKVKNWFFGYWRLVLSFSSALGFILFLYAFQINALTGGFSLSEKKYISSTSYISNIVQETVFLPHKILSFGANALSDNHFFVRYPSAILMVVMIGSFYALMTRWYTRRIALLTTLLFTTSSWTLTIGRQALPTVMYLSWLPILALLYWTVSKQKQNLTIMLWALSIGLALYIPGLLWFVIILAISQRKRLKHILSNTPYWQIIAGSIVMLLLLTPFVWSAINTPLVALQSIGLPNSIDQITGFPSRLLDVFVQTFIYSSGNPVFQLGRLPYLDVASSILFFIGLYRLRFSSARKMMGWSGLVFIGWLIGAGLGTINLAIFLPLIYVFIGSGISFLLVQWFKVFPKNPIARTLAACMVTTLVLFISFYHLARYFIAWPLNPATKSAFSAQDAKIDR